MTPSLTTLVRAIAAGDSRAVTQLIDASPGLAKEASTVGALRNGAASYFVEPLGMYVMAGDTALHFAAAAYRLDLVKTLVALGADVRARNRRGGEPLHAACVGAPGSSGWNPTAQADVVTYLISAGADPNAANKDGATPLHRAVRTRCAAAVRALLDNGADPRRKNKSGSTPMELAHLTTGRGGSGSAAAKEQQAEIIGLLDAALRTTRRGARRSD